jgi:hypothetical protein
MKVSEFLSKCDKEQIPFYLYTGTGSGYKISCLDCNFFKKNKLGIYMCTSVFYNGCKDEFTKWVLEKDMPNDN